MHLQKQKRQMTEGSIWKPLTLLALPLLGSSLIQQLYSTVDLIFVGNFIGKSASAAVGASSLIVTCLVGFFTGLAVGASVVAAQYCGAKDEKNLQATVHTAMTVSILGGLALMILGFFVSPFILQWMNTPDSILPTAVSYIRIYFFSIPSLMIYNVGSGLLRASGDAKRPLYYLIAGGLANVLADWLFTGVFYWGVQGVAWATMLSQSLSALLLLVHFFRTKEPYRLHWKKLRIHWAKLRKILRIGLPAGVQAMVITFSNMVVQYHINGFGENSIAAFTVYFKVENFIYLPLLAFGQAMTTFSGQNMGAQQYARVKKGTWICLAMSIGVTALISSVILFLGRPLLGIFNPDPLVVEEGMQILFITCPLYLLYSFIETFAGTLRGAGSSLMPMGIIMANLCVLRVILLFIFVPLYHSIVTIAWLYPATWTTTSLCLLFYYGKGRWLHRYQKGHKPAAELAEPTKEACEF